MEPDHSPGTEPPNLMAAGSGPGPITIPDHEMLRCIGWGSYGQVWLARNIMGAHRAVKVIFRKSFTDPRPFDREVSGIRSFEPISRLHDGLVDVLHTGMNEAGGYFYYIMELADDQAPGSHFDPVKYVPNTLSAEVARRGKLSLSECLKLGIDLTQALNDLHQHALVHRDVKPSNIVFVNGRPKLADIGLVADVHEARSYVGTEGFIPPEGPGSAQADLFSLGKVLYEASTGMDRQDFPELPAAWSESPDYPGLLELNEVLLRACHPSPARRYASAWDMHADLLLVLNGKSVKRLRVLEQRMVRFKRAAGLAAVALGLAAAFSYQVYWQRSTAREARRQQISANVSRGNRAVDAGDLLGALPYFAKALQLDGGDPDAELDHRLCLGSALEQCPRLTQLWLRTNRVNYAAFSPSGERVLLAEARGKAEIRDYRTGQLYGHPLELRFGIDTAAYSPDGRWIATASQSHTAILWDAESLSPSQDLPHLSNVLSIRFSHDATRVVTACMDGHAYVWDVKTGHLEFRLGQGTAVIRFADFSRDGRWIATADIDGRVEIWSAKTGQSSGRYFLHTNWVSGLAFSPDGRRLVTACDDHKAHVWDLATGKKILPNLRHDAPVRSVEFSPDGRLILTASFDGTARLWQADDLQPLESNPILRHEKGLDYASFSPDGRRVITASVDGWVEIWDLAGSTMHYVPRAGSFSGDGARYVILTNDTMEVHDTVSGQVIVSLPAGQPTPQRTELNGDGTVVVSLALEAGGPTNAWVRVWQVPEARPLGPAWLVTNTLDGLAVSGAGTRLLTWSGNTGQIRDGATGAVVSRIRVQDGPIRSASFDRRAERVLTISTNRVQVWEATTGQSACPAFEHPVSVEHAEFSADGQYIITCCADPNVVPRFAQVWSAATGKPLGTPLWHADGVLYAGFSRDASRIITGSEDSTAVVWDRPSASRISLALKHGDHVPAAAFNRDATWVATASADHSARVWDPETSEALTPPLRHPGSLTRVSFLPDGRHLLTQDEQGGAYLWTLPVDNGRVNDLVELAGFLSGARATLANPTEQELKSARAAWERMRRTFPALFTTSHQEVIRWHESQARESEQDQDWFAARFQLQQLLRLLPNDPSVKERLANALSHLATENGASPAPEE